SDIFMLFISTVSISILSYSFSLHDALPISGSPRSISATAFAGKVKCRQGNRKQTARWAGMSSMITAQTDRPAEQKALRLWPGVRSEEHTSELQSHLNLVCRLLLEKKNSNLF